MKFEYANLWKEDGFIIPLPMIILHKQDHERSIAFGWLIWGFEWQFDKKPKPTLYVWCNDPIPRILTKGKEYQIIKSKLEFYVVKRDDGSIDRVDKSRFSEPFQL